VSSDELAPNPDIDLLAASLRADSSDVGAFVESLAVKLEEALPGRTQVERRRTGLFGGKRVQAMALDAGDRRLEIRVRGGGLEASVSRLSGGIVLRRESVDTDAWLSALGEALGQEAKRSDATRRALERLLIR
jgi:hypothetical protein